MACHHRPGAVLLVLSVCVTLLVLVLYQPQLVIPRWRGPSSGELPPLQRQPPCPPPGQLVTAAKRGRLGNIMFEYAALLSARHALARPVWLLPEMKDELEGYFTPLPMPSLPRGCTYNWTEVSVDALIKDAHKDDERNFLIAGYPTSVHLFHSMRARVLRDLTFLPNIRQNANLRLIELSGQKNLTSPTFIGVHVRRTDYRQWMKVHTGGRLVESDFIQRALALMRSRHRDTLFVVASDDLEWCESELISRSNATDIVLAGDGVQTRPGADLALLAACNHSVVTHGTFGFWGAFLAGGEVVAPTGYGTRQTGVEHNVRRAALNWTWIPAFSPKTSTVNADANRETTKMPRA